MCDCVPCGYGLEGLGTALEARAVPRAKTRHWAVASREPWPREHPLAFPNGQVAFELLSEGRVHDSTDKSWHATRCVHAVAHALPEWRERRDGLHHAHARGATAQRAQP